jgi:hypothetical protein
LAFLPVGCAITSQIVFFVPFVGFVRTRLCHRLSLVESRISHQVHRGHKEHCFTTPHHFPLNFFANQAKPDGRRMVEQPVEKPAPVQTDLPTLAIFASSAAWRETSLSPALS